jgi:hypothetical protein
VGEGVLDIVPLHADQPIVAGCRSWLCSACSSPTAMKVGLRDLSSAWRLPGRALLFGLPLTLLGNALLGHYVVGLAWVAAFLVGAVLRGCLGSGVRKVADTLRA